MLQLEYKFNSFFMCVSINFPAVKSSSSAVNGLLELQIEVHCDSF